jgi:hypothetical protein
MSAAEQVQYESQVRMRYAIIAFAAALLIVGSQLIQLSGPHTSVDELTLDLLTAHKRFPIDLIGAVVDSCGLIALMFMLRWLHQIARARNPAIRDWARWLFIVGAVLSAVMAVAYAIVIAVKANQFATTGDQSYVEANKLTTGGLVVVLPLLAQLGSLLLTAGFIWTALNALRVGLLTRPLGYAGVLAGALVLFPLGAFVPVVQGFWLVSISVLFAGRWPNGAPPAWVSGEAVPWTPLGQPRGQAAAPRPARHRRAQLADVKAASSKGANGKAPGAAAAAVVEPDADALRTRASAPKRKRKRRS